MIDLQSLRDRCIKVKHVAGVDDFVGMYNALYSNAADLQTQSL